MTDKKEDKLLNKIEQLSNQLVSLSKDVTDLKQDYSREKVNSKNNNQSTFIMGLIVGIIAGVMSNFLVPFVMEVYGSASAPSWFAPVVSFVLIAVFAVLLFRMNNIVKTLSSNI